MLTKLLDTERLIHSVKTAIACIIGLLLSTLIGFPVAQWVIITIMVVMCAQLYVGSVLQKSYMRFMGTCMGCLFAVIVIEFINDSNFAMAATIGIAGFLFSYIATSQDSFSNAGTLGGATTAIILLGQKQEPTIAFAIERFLEISLGIFIAMLVSQFVLPIHARTHLRRTQASTLTEILILYQQIMLSQPSRMQSINYLDLDEKIVKSLSKQRQLAKESDHEPKGSSFDPINFMHPFYCEKEILRAIDFMHDAQVHLATIESDFIHSDNVKKFHEEVVDSLNMLIKAINSKSLIEEHIHLPKLDGIKAFAGQHFYVDGFIFSAEVLTKNLGELAQFYHLKRYQE